MRGALCLAALAVIACSARAADVPIPTAATLTAMEVSDSVRLPVGPWVDGAVPQRSAEGAVTRRAWSVPRPGLTTLQLIAPLREALVEQGYEPLYACKDIECGGFDFRYALALLPEPDMHVDLGDFRYLVAAQGDALASIVVSRSSTAGFIHMTEVDPTPVVVPVLEDPVEVSVADADPGSGASQGDISAALDQDGRAVLSGLRFAAGASELEDEDFDALDELAEWLRLRPGAQVVLVGHSDATGSLQSNIAISRARASAVTERLTGAYGIDPGRLAFEGVGYLAPRANNATDDGRTRNRRVEVVVLSLE